MDVHTIFSQELVILENIQKTGGMRERRPAGIAHAEMKSMSAFPRQTPRERRITAGCALCDPRTRARLSVLLLHFFPPNL